MLQEIRRCAEGDAWMEWIMDLCESLSPQAVHVNGVDHQPWFYPATFSADKLARRQRLIAIHCWIEFTKARKRGGALDRVCTHLAPAMAVLARELRLLVDCPIGITIAHTKTNAIQTVREVWWDIRPHPNFGTVELRICDGLPTLDEIAAVAAMSQCLVEQMDGQLDRGYTLPEPRESWEKSVDPVAP